VVTHDTQQNIEDTYGTYGLFIPTSLEDYAFLKHLKINYHSFKMLVLKTIRTMHLSRLKCSILLLLS